MATILPNSVVGHFEQFVDHDYYRVDLTAGQRYYFQIERLFAGSGLVYSGAELRLVDTSGQELQKIQRAGGERAPIGFVYTAEKTGSFYLDASNFITYNGTAYAGGDYRLTAFALAPEDRPDTRDHARALTLQTPISDLLDLPGDQDWLKVDLKAGHQYRFDFHNLETAAEVKTSLSIYTAAGSLVQTPAYGYHDAVSLLQPSASGTYYLLLERDTFAGASLGPQRYTFTATEYGAGSSLVPAATAGATAVAAVVGATPLPINTPQTATLEAQPEKDVYEVALAPGHRYLFELVPSGSKPVGLTSLWVEASDRSQAAIDTSGMNGTSLAVLQAAPGVAAWTVKVTNEYISVINGKPVTGEYTLRYTEVAPDDHTDLIGAAATRLVPGTPVNGNFDYRLDADVFQVQLVQGRTYEYRMSGSGSNPSKYFSIAVANAAGDVISVGNTLPSNAGDAGNFVATASGLYYLIARDINNSSDRTDGGDYTLQIAEPAADDHGSTLATATPLKLDTSVAGNFEMLKDHDLFRFDTVAGQRYAIQLTKGSGTSSILVSLMDAAGSILLSDAVLAPGSGNPAGTLYYSTPMAATLYLDIEHVGTTATGSYTVRLAAAPKDDVADSPAQAQALGTAAPGQPFTGTAGVDTMTGSRFGDVFRESPGNDTIAGGDGIDTVQYAGARAAYTLKKAASGWQVSASATGTDTLTGIERLAFDGPDLALDLAGNAGTVVKILGALFGPASVKNAGYVGYGLMVLDQGMSYPDLVAQVVAAPVFTQAAGGTSNGAFVRYVFNNLFGRLPSAEEQKPYVQLLDEGAYTQASMAYAACELAANATHVDLVGLAQTGIAFLP